jgi:HD-like signal output (HDOD) protein
VDDQAFAAQLESILLNRISTDRLVLPAFPTVAQRCLALVQSGEAAPKQIAATIEQDPMLVAQESPQRRCTGAPSRRSRRR